MRIRPLSHFLWVSLHLAVSLAVLLFAGGACPSLVAQDWWRNAWSEATAAVNVPPQRSSGSPARVPPMYGGYGTTTAAAPRVVRPITTPPQAAPRGTTTATTRHPASYQTTARPPEPRRLPSPPANSGTAYFAPVELPRDVVEYVEYDETDGTIVQASYIDEPVRGAPTTATPPPHYRPTSVAHMPLPSPSLTESWDIEGRLAAPMSESRSVAASSATFVPTAATTAAATTARIAAPSAPLSASAPRTLYQAHTSPHPALHPAASPQQVPYTPMVGSAPNAARNGVAPVTTRPSLTTSASPAPPSLWKRFTSDFRPSNDRRWAPNLAVLPTVEFRGNSATIRNVRYTLYQTKESYTPRYYDATFNINDLQTLDIIVAPFPAMPSVGHVELSFGFADGRHIILSVEPRFEEGEKDDSLGAMANQFELMYLFADERDAVRLYTQVGRGEVFLYRLAMTPEETRKVFESAAVRANTLAANPEFYHGITNNCATNLFTHINYARPGAIPRDYRARFPGLIDKLLLERKMIVTNATSIKDAREAAKINKVAEDYGDLEHFSAGIRQHLF